MNERVIGDSQMALDTMVLHRASGPVGLDPARACMDNPLSQVSWGGLVEGYYALDIRRYRG
jgi:hypothetical protein